jgi:hypothetical protein
MNPFRRKEISFDYTILRDCLNCGSGFAGQYCSRCGERVLVEDDRSFKHYLSDLFNAFTFIDGKFFRSIKSLILDPGKMSSSVSSGIRQPYMKPIAFFFVANFIYFLFPIFNTFNTPLEVQLDSLYADLAGKMVQNHLAATGQTMEEFKVVYNATSTGWSKLLLCLLIVYIFPLVCLINFSRRVYVLDHLTYSVELITFILFVPTILLGFTLLAIIRVFAFVGIDVAVIGRDTYAVPIVVISFIYFYIRSLRTFYKFSTKRVVLNTFLLLASTYVLVPIYRFTLFLVTMWEL